MTTNESILLERERCLKAVDDEPEMTDSMPDGMWLFIRNNREASEAAFRVMIREAKYNIRKRILSANVEVTDEAKRNSVH